MIWNMFSSRFLLPEFFFLHYQFNTLHSTTVHILWVMLLFNFMLLGGTRGGVRRVFVHLSVN